LSAGAVIACNYIVARHATRCHRHAHLFVSASCPTWPRRSPWVAVHFWSGNTEQKTSHSVNFLSNDEPYRTAAPIMLKLGDVLALYMAFSAPEPWDYTLYSARATRDKPKRARLCASARTQQYNDSQVAYNKNRVVRTIGVEDFARLPLAGTLWRPRLLSLSTAAGSALPQG
jgi:hypothetical protein